MKKLLLVVLSLMLTLTLAGTAMGEGLAVGTYCLLYTSRCV